MKKTRTVSQALIGGIFALFAASAIAAGWVKYESKPYGFSMLIPAGTAVKETEQGGEWGGLTAVREGVKLSGLAKLGAKETDEAIEKYAISKIGIPASAWTKVDEGTDANGWSRYRVFKATQGAKLVFGAYGVGPKGNYLLYLETTPADYDAHKDEYDKWYESISVK